MKEDPNIVFLLTEEKWGVFFIKEQGTGEIYGVEIITQNPTGGHKVTFKAKGFEVDVEEWTNEPISDDTKSNKE